MSWWHSITVGAQKSPILLVLFLRCIVCEYCDVSGHCNWTITRGFEEFTWDTLPQQMCGSGCPGMALSHDGFLVLEAAKATRGTIEIDLISTVSHGTTKLLTFDAYVMSNVVSNEQGDSSNNLLDIIVHTVSTTNDYTINNITLSNSGRWQRVHTNITDQTTSYRVLLDAFMRRDIEFLALANITILDTSSESDLCSKDDLFACSNAECVQWDKACNLQEECSNGRDEIVCGDLSPFMRCTFEDDFCGWHNVLNKDDGANKGHPRDHFDWRRGKGPSDTPNTGPEVDHTKGTLEGYYLFIESSDGGLLEHATLQSNVLPPIPEEHREHCMVRFFYHMIGRDVGSLEVALIDLCMEKRHRRPLRVWYKEGNQENKWNFAEVALGNVKSRYVIQFTASGALMHHGDIALDDISISPECFGIRHNSTNYLQQSGHIETLTWSEFANDTNFFCEIPQEGTAAGNTSDKPVSERRESSSVTGVSSVHPTSHDEEKMGLSYIIASAVVISILMGATVLCLVLRNRKQNSAPVARLEMVSAASNENCNSVPVQSSSIDMQLRCAVTELNPNYDFITAKYPEQQLREIPRNKLKLIRLLGQGAFGEVYEGGLKNMSANVDEMSVAVKTLQALSTDQAETDFLMEAVIISKFMHKNVVKCIGVCFEEHPRYIILELLEGGDLKTFLRDSRPKGDEPCELNMKDLVKLSIDVANGCHHLEEKHFVHRDIAARNCLLTTRGPGRVAKIADFGMSRDIYSADYYRKGGKTMLPIKWMPPEAFLDGVFTSKTDIWSFGVLLWEIFTLGYMPYPGLSNTDVMHFVSSGGRLDPPQNSPARLNKIMILCWNCIADIRPSFSEIIELLDMCLQDNDVLLADVGACYFLIADGFKDASTLAKTVEDPGTTDDNNRSPSIDDFVSSVAEFRGHVESESREPLLLSSPDT